MKVDEDGVKVACRFRYPFPVDWHFKYRHAVNDHNNLRHALPSEVRVFSFILAVCEVNAFLEMRYFNYAKGMIEGRPTLLVFCRRLA